MARPGAFPGKKSPLGGLRRNKQGNLPPPLWQRADRPKGTPPPLTLRREPLPPMHERSKTRVGETNARTISGRDRGFWAGTHPDGRLWDERDNNDTPVNEWVEVVSTWINRAKFEPMYDMLGSMELEGGSLLVEFLDLAMVRYDNVHADKWQEMINSSSKGMWLHHNMVDRNYPYELLRGPSRKVTKEMIGEREPPPLSPSRFWRKLP